MHAATLLYYDAQILRSLLEFLVRRIHISRPNRTSYRRGASL